MRVLNVIWAFSTGGIAKLFLTYAALGQFDPELEISSVCIDLKKCDYDRAPLYEADIQIVAIKNRRDFSWIKALGKIAEKINPDVVFCHGFNGPIIIKVASMLSKSLQVPMVCTYHGIYNPPTPSRKLVANFINLSQAWIYKKYAHTIVLVAKYSGKYLLERGVPIEKMEVVYNGIQKEAPYMPVVSLQHEGVSIGMTGRLDAIKGINYLIDAASEVRKRTNKAFHIYIIGDGPEEPVLREQTKRLGVEDVVSFCGYQNNVSAWLKEWDIFCLPSLQENHSIALLEAMRASKAIVCTSVGGNPETVVDGKEALIVPSKDCNALADALVKMIDDEGLRKKLGKNANARFEECFTEEVMKRELCRILKDAAK